MSAAQDKLAPFVSWVRASSLTEKAPLGHDYIVRGPWLVFVPSALDVPPLQTFAAGHLPVWIPESQTIPGLPPYTQPAPENQASLTDRLRHVLWMFSSGRFAGALVGLTDPYESLQSALDRQVPGLNVTETPVYFLPLFALALAPDDYAFVAGKLPFVSV